MTWLDKIKDGFSAVSIKISQTIDRIGTRGTDAKQCAWLIVDTQSFTAFSQEVHSSAWTLHATVRRPSDNNEDIVLFRAVAPITSAKP